MDFNINMYLKKKLSLAISGKLRQLRQIAPNFLRAKICPNKVFIDQKAKKSWRQGWTRLVKKYS